MGCASSAALPFLTNRGNQAVSETPRLNGEPPYELKMVNNKLRENGVANVKDVNEAYGSERTKAAADSTAVQGVVGGIVQTKDEIVGQVKGFGEALSEKVTSAVDGAEEAVGSAFGAAEAVEDRARSEVAAMEESVRAALGAGGEEMGEVKAEELEELLESLPRAEEVGGAAGEGVLERAVEEVRGEEEDGE